MATNHIEFGQPKIKRREECIMCGHELIPPKRKVVQIEAMPHHPNYLNLAALCDDGTIWEFCNNDKRWRRIPDIPQDEVKDETD